MYKPVYIHYGAMEFEPTKGFPIKNRECFTKPTGGLWASRKSATFGWRDWCHREDYDFCELEKSFEFTLKDTSRVISISNLEHLHNLPKKETLWGWTYNIDFEECLYLGIDAIELCWYGSEYKDVARDDLHFDLYGWDCESIVVLNPNIVIPLKRDVSSCIKSKI